MGAVIEVVRRYVPATYKAMIDVTSADEKLYATTDLQALADYVKYRLFATVVTDSAEATTYNPFQQQFIGKLTTLQFIPAAIDFWDSKLISETLTGSNEVTEYRDNRVGLMRLYESLKKEVNEESGVLGFSFKLGGLIPRVSYGDGDKDVLITPDPQDFPSMTEPNSWLWSPWGP